MKKITTLCGIFIISSILVAKPVHAFFGAVMKAAATAGKAAKSAPLTKAVVATETIETAIPKNKIGINANEIHISKQNPIVEKNTAHSGEAESKNKIYDEILTVDDNDNASDNAVNRETDIGDIEYFIYLCLAVIAAGLFFIVINNKKNKQEKNSLL